MQRDVIQYSMILLLLNDCRLDHSTLAKSRIRICWQCRGRGRAQRGPRPLAQYGFGCIRFQLIITIFCSSDHSREWISIIVAYTNSNTESKSQLCKNLMHQVPTHHNITFCSRNHSSVWIFIIGQQTHPCRIIPFHAKSMHGISVFGNSNFSVA